MIQGAMNSLMGGNQTSQGASPLAPLNAVEQGSNAGLQHFAFPSDLGTQAFYIRFASVKRQRSRRTGDTKETLIKYIHLPLPPNLNDSLQSNYTQEGIGLFGEMGREIGDKLAGGVGLGDMTMKKVEELIEGSVKYQATKLLSLIHI